MTTKITLQEIADRQTDAWNSRDAARVASLYAEAAMVHDPMYPEPLSGRAAVEKDAAEFFTAVPDFSFRTTRTAQDGDTLIFEGVVSGTHLGPLSLPSGLVPATNKKLQFAIAGFGNIDAEGNISNERRYYDVATILDQLGLMQ